jgi:hypothetical protein
VLPLSKVFDIQSGSEWRLITFLEVTLRGNIKWWLDFIVGVVDGIFAGGLLKKCSSNGILGKRETIFGLYGWNERIF